MVKWHQTTPIVLKCWATWMSRSSLSASYQITSTNPLFESPTLTFHGPSMSPWVQLRLAEIWKGLHNNLSTQHDAAAYLHRNLLLIPKPQLAATVDLKQSASLVPSFLLFFPSLLWFEPRHSDQANRSIYIGVVLGNVNQQNVRYLETCDIYYTSQ